MRQKGIVGVFVFVLVLVLAVVGGAYYLGRITTRLQPTKTQQQTQATPSPDPTANWKTYTNETYGYSFRYPLGWTWEPNTDTAYPLGNQESVFKKGEYRNGYGFGTNVTKTDKTLEEFVRPQLCPAPGSCEPTNATKQEQITVGGIPSVWQEAIYGQGGQFIKVYIPFKESFILTIEAPNSVSDESITNKDLAKKDLETFKQILSTFKFANQTQTGQISDICITEKIEIISVVINFENLQKVRDPKGVLALFTPPQSKQETDDYNNLRLYSNVSTSYKTKSYDVVQEPTKSSDNFCGVVVEEQRSNYGGPANPQYLPAQTQDFTLFLTKQNGEWKIDQYQSQDTRIKKGKYAGFLMEYSN